MTITAGYIRKQVEPYSDDTPMLVTVESDGDVSFAPIVEPPPPAGESQAVLDLRNFLSENLLCGAMWSIEGYTSWQTDRVSEGHRIVPAIHLKGRSWMDLPKTLPRINNPAVDNSWATMLEAVAAMGLPLIVRVDNLNSWINHDDYDDGKPAVPTVRESPRKLIQNADGSVSSFKNQADWLAGNALWTVEGEKWADHVVSQTVCQMVPDPPWVQHLENNEGPRTTPYTGLKQPQSARQWDTPANVASRDLRLKEYLDAQGWPAFDSVLPPFYAAVNGQYEAYYDGLRTEYPDGAWSDFYAAAYKCDGPGSDKPAPAGSSPLGEDERVDASSSEYYVRPLSADLTSADQKLRLDLKLERRDYRRQHNPQAFTSISVSVLPKTAYQSAKAGIHGVLDPKMFGDWMGWLCWHVHDGGPVQLVWWDDSNVKPTDLFWGIKSTPEVIDPVHEAILDDLGRPDLKTVTCADYPLAMLGAIKAILDHETLRRHWTDGKNLKLYPTSLKVDLWYAANQLDDRVLVYAWSPVESPQPAMVEIDIDNDGTPEQYEIPGPGYWVVTAGGVSAIE